MHVHQPEKEVHNNHADNDTSPIYFGLSREFVRHIDDLIAETKEEPLPLTEKQREALETFDSLELDSNMVTGAIGVLSGIKPVALFEQISQKPAPVSLITKMGLTCAEVADAMLVSKNPELSAIAGRLFETEAFFRKDETAHLVGSLLGYPKTATDFFIHRASLIDEHEKSPEMVDASELAHPAFCEFILSPDHTEEEIAAYAEPLRAAVEQMAPQSYNRITKPETNSPKLYGQAATTMVSLENKIA